ncbi:MAG: type II 3-dehydroquinate dehydratase [Cardiobacteriaceae bacterium]|nr:type II 3-dehydroquinate dehydratase [Cardiobacteriaceae bacterium]
MALILVINGPNLNLLGQREPQHYGNDTLEQLEKRLVQLAQELGHQLEFIQHNHEGMLIDLIHEAGKHRVDYIIINPAAYTHTSVALRDALSAVHIPFIEVHLSNVFQREPFRQHSYFSDIAQGIIAGLGVDGYELALLAAHQQLLRTQNH